jgi:hypothetical protein
MIRRNSLILFGVFIVLLAGILYVNQDSNLQVTLGMQTATPTELPKITSGFDFSKLNSFTIKSQNGPNYSINMQKNGAWVTSKNEPVMIDAVFQFTTSMTGLTRMDSVDANISLDKVGLNPPQTEILLTDSDGNHASFTIGTMTPIQTGYYVKWNTNPITIVSKDQISSILGLFTPETLFEPTATPATAVLPAITPTASK